MPLTEFTILATCPSCGYGSLRCPSCSKYFEELTVPITEVFGEQLEDIGDVLSDEQIQQLAQSRLVPLSHGIQQPAVALEQRRLGTGSQRTAQDLFGPPDAPVSDLALGAFQDLVGWSHALR